MYDLTVYQRTLSKSIMSTIPPEHWEAVCLKWWLDKKWLKYNHSPNEAGQKSSLHVMHIQRKKKQEWMSAGFPDYIIFIKKYCVFVELKRQRRELANWKLGWSPSRVSEEQQEWVDYLNTLDYCIADICYWWEDAVQFINYCIAKGKK